MAKKILSYDPNKMARKGLPHCAYCIFALEVLLISFKHILRNRPLEIKKKLSLSLLLFDVQRENNEFLKYKHSARNTQFYA